MNFFFKPVSVAIIGASASRAKLSGVILDSLERAGFTGDVYPINPKHKSVKGKKCYASFNDLNKKVDLAVFALPAYRVPSALEEAVGYIRGAIIVSGGFAEAGLDGAAFEASVKKIAAERGIRVIGPNCLGIYDTISGLDTFFISAQRLKRPGKGTLSILSQSGSFAVTAMDELSAEGIGVARIISYGNRVDVNEADCLEFLEKDEHTGAVALYVESIENGRRFVEAAARVSAKKPVFAIKVGKGNAGAIAAKSHTGAIAGRYEVYRAAFRKAGIIELGGYDDFISACKVFGADSGVKSSSGNRVVIITDGGGIGVGIADECASAGLYTPHPSEELTVDLKRDFPSYFAVGNPIDLTGSVTDAMYVSALEKTMAGTEFDIAVVAALWGPPALSDALPGLLARAARKFKKPVIICSPGGEYSRKKAALFRKAGFPVFATPESAVKAASALARRAVNKAG